MSFSKDFFMFLFQPKNLGQKISIAFFFKFYAYSKRIISYEATPSSGMFKNI